MSAGMATNVFSRQVTTSSKGKQLKQFLGKKETLSLAAAISDVQEKKIRLKMERNHRLQTAQPQQIPKTLSRTKSKLKKTKDMLVARRMQAKRNKARSRKQHLLGDVDQEGSRVGQSVETAHKKVSFL